MRIGELAGATGVAAKTIRYYEDIGLMSEPPRTVSGYRNYDWSAATRLEFIKAAQSVGLSLGEIKEIMAFRDRGETPCRHVVGLIENRAVDLGERIEALKQMQRDLIKLANKARRLPAAGQGAYCHIIETIETSRRPKARSFPT